jgi:hypothetical protein
MNSWGKEKLVGASAPFCSCMALGEKRGGDGGGPVWAAPHGGKEGEAWARSCHADGGRRGGPDGQQGTLPAEADTGQRYVSRGGEGGMRGPCVRTWASPREQCQF